MLYELPSYATVYFLVVAGVFGLVFGSFSNAWAWRIANNEKITKGRSHCTSCGHTLGFLDLVPLFSWLFLKGKCRYCKAPISKRYPLVELICCILFVSILAVYGLSFDTLRYIIVGICLLILSLVDYNTMEIPNGFLIAIAVISLLRLFTPGAWKDMLLGLIVPAFMLIVVLIMDKVLKKESMGGGDIKLIAALSLHFGLWLSILLLIFACIIGLIVAFINKKGKDNPFPFGPSISIAAWIIMMCGTPLLNWYLGLFSI